MNLTPIEPDILPLALKAVAERLEPGSVAVAAFDRVAAIADELELRRIRLITGGPPVHLSTGLG